MALVFRCDGCGRLESDGLRNKGQGGKAGSISLVRDPEKYRQGPHEVTKDLCKSCIDGIVKGLENLASHSLNAEVTEG